MFSRESSLKDVTQHGLVGNAKDHLAKASVRGASFNGSNAPAAVEKGSIFSELSTPDLLSHTFSDSTLAHSTLDPSTFDRFLPPRKKEFFQFRFSKLTAEEQSEILNKAYKKLNEILEQPQNFETPAFSHDRITELKKQSELIDVSNQERVVSFAKLITMHPAIAELAQNEIYKHVASYWPGVVLALDHLAGGGHIGLLTARSSREGCRSLVAAIVNFLGHDIPPDSIHFINDAKNNHHVQHLNTSAMRKLAVLHMFFNGYKFDQECRPIQSQNPFEQITFLDDEPRNIHLIRDFVAHSILIDYWRKNEPEQAPKIAADDYHAVKETTKKVTHSVNTKGLDLDTVWKSINRNLGRDYGNGINQRLRFVLTQDVDVERTWQSLMKKLANNTPTNDRSHNRLLMLDIDGTLAELEGDIYVRDKTQPEKILLSIPQEQIASDPCNDNWKLKASKLHPEIPYENLVMDYSNMDKHERVSLAVAKGLMGNRMFKANAKPHGKTVATKSVPAMRAPLP